MNEPTPPTHTSRSGPKNEPTAAPERHVDDDLTPRSAPDEPNRMDSRSPAEKAYDDWGPGDPDEPPEERPS